MIEGSQRGPKDLRLLLPALWGWLVCALGIWLRPGPALSLAVLILTVVLCAWAWRSRRVVIAWVALAGIIATTLLGSIALGELTREQAAVMEASGQDVVAQVRLEKGFTPGMSSVEVRILRLNGAALSGGGVEARVIGFPFAQRVAFGASAELKAYLQQAGPTEGAGWVLMAREPATLITPPGAFLSGIDDLRQGLLSASMERPGDGGRLLPGLAIGDTSEVDRGLIEAMRVTSLSHLVAVSGANCAIVVAIVVALVALFRGGVWIRMGAGILALVGFVILVTPEPSIIRASIMASIVLVSLASSRPVRGIPVLGMTVLGLLAINPWLALDFAFALSVMATGGILLLALPVTKRLSRYMPAPLAVVIALPVAAQIACQPILILLNPVIPVFAVPANVLAAPAAPLATIVGMLACVVSGVLPALATGLVWLAWWPSAYIAAIGRSLAAIPFATIAWPPGWWGLISAAALGYLAITWLLLTSQRHRGLRRVIAGVWGIVALAVMTGFLAPRAILKAGIPADWSIAQCDVGQGDAILIRSGEEVALIDAGESPRALSECFDLLGVREIDLAIITHFDIDHVGGWPALAGRTPLVWRGPALGSQDRDIVSALELSGAMVQEVVSGDALRLGDSLLEVVWPTDTSLSEPGNDSSVVVTLTPLEGCASCLSGIFLGDLGDIPQRILAGRETLGGVDVVKVSHHGSSDQYAGLYEELGAQAGLIGVGAENTYGHPTDRALGMLENLGVTTLRSDQRGTVTLGKNAAGALVMWSEREQPAG